MTIDELFGNGRDLEWYQMGSRALVVFLITLAFLRFSGTRAFGMRSPFDNVLGILLGAVLSRTITGASEFFPTVFGAMIITILHRCFAWLSLKNEKIGWLVKGKATTIFENGSMNFDNMSRCLVTRKDLLESVREAGFDSLDKIESATVERSGRISVIPKTNPNQNSTH
jgi:uncharacterized membrane protein YcaP (DUF421 family)